MSMSRQIPVLKDCESLQEYAPHFEELRKTKQSILSVNNRQN